MVKATTVKEQIKIPDGVTITIDGNILTVKGEKGELKKTFTHPKINMKINNNTN